MYKKIVSLTMAACILLSVLAMPMGAAAEQFSDVPTTSYAYSDILLLREQGIADGIGNNLFGTLQTITRGEFVTMLSRLMKWDVSVLAPVSFADISATDALYAYAYPHICAAVKLGALPDGTAFRPSEPITREEIAVMLVNSLGYVALSKDKLITERVSPFGDISLVTHPATYSKLIMAYDFGIINGTPVDGVQSFLPANSATREEAAAMVVRLYNRYSTPLQDIHGFYWPVTRTTQSYMLPTLDGTSFCWAKLEYWNSKGGSYLNMTSSNSNSWYRPANGDELLASAKEGGRTANLSFQLGTDQKVTLPDGVVYRDYELILKNPAQRASAIAQICAAMDGGFTGVTVDIEGLKTAEYAVLLNSFLSELDAALAAKSPALLLYIAVPVRDWYKGYDFRTIGNICDKVILMAHDYANKSLPEYMANTDMPKTAHTPFNRIYDALRDVTNPIDGVADKSKIMLAVSFATVRWEIENGKVTNFAKAGLSDTGNLYKRLGNADTERFYDDVLQAPAIRYPGSKPNSSNVVWYEDSRSIGAKIDLAAMFGIKSVSLWSIGVVPDYTNAGMNFDVWQTILNKRIKK